MRRQSQDKTTSPTAKTAAKKPEVVQQKLPQPLDQKALRQVGGGARHPGSFW